MAQDRKGPAKDRDYYAAGGTFDDSQPWQQPRRPNKRSVNPVVEPETARRRRVRRRKGYDSFREIVLFALLLIVLIVVREVWWG